MVMKILLVDDEKKIQNVLSTMFERRGFQVVVAGSGAAALDAARREMPDLVISDVMMPDMDGFQLRRAMLNDDLLADIPFVFYSGKYASKKSRLLAEKLGVSHFISKPANNKEFFATIEQLLDEHGEKTRPSARQKEVSGEDFTESYQDVLLERVLETNLELETAHKFQQIMNNLLHLTLVDLTLQELLDALLEQIISFPWFDLLSKGAIFIRRGNVLRLMAQRGLHETLLEKCDSVPFGRCLCGRSAESGEVVFADQVDDRHDIHYSGIQPHGHYCVPIKTGSGEVLGVFTLYLDAGAVRRKDIEESLENAARTAAAIIMRKMKEEELKQYYDELNALNKASNKLLFRGEDEEALPSYICRVACESFKLRMVWLGLLEEGKRLRAAAAFGERTDYLDSIVIRCHNVDEGTGPSCMAIKTGKPVACNDIEHDPIFAPWRDKALASGFRSSLALPLIDVEKGSQGTLNMYSDEKGFFNPERIVILTAFVNNVVAVLDNEKLISNLEEKVKERTVELESARNLAEAADRAKSSFLANMSHELRTPLNSIIGFSEIMLQGISGALAPDQQEYLNDILESGQHLHSLVNDILDLSKIEADMMELEYGEIILEDLLTRCLIMVREKALKHRISISTEIQPELSVMEGDERRLRQVVVNLLSNAVKFSPDGGKVRIVAKYFQGKKTESAEQKTGDFVIISVSDTGEGIAAEDQGKLFKPFVQIGARTRKMEGTGLGLALCKRIIEQHNGRIFLASEPGHGSVFSFIVPARRSSQSVKYPPVFLPWSYFLQHIERIGSIAGRAKSSFLLLKLEHDEGVSHVNWNEIVVTFTGQIRAHEFFSREPGEGVFYFLLTGDGSTEPEAAVARLADVLGGIGVAASFRRARYPEDGATGMALLRHLGYKG